MTTTTLEREFVERIKGEIGFADEQMIKWLDWMDGVIGAIRADDYGEYSPANSPVDHYSVFAALVPLGTQVAEPGSVHEMLEGLLLAADKLGEYGIYHIVDEETNRPLIGIRRD